jgi:hypothetical protein
MNIMIDENGTPFLIDFGSCLPVGGKLMTAGTPGWVEDDFETSQISHDEFSLGKLKSWLANPTDSDEMKYAEAHKGTSTLVSYGVLTQPQGGQSATNVLVYLAESLKS